MAIVVFPKSKSNLAFLESLIIIVFAFLLLVGCLQGCWCHICTHALKVLSCYCLCKVTLESTTFKVTEVGAWCASHFETDSTCQHSIMVNGLFSFDIPWYKIFAFVISCYSLVLDLSRLRTMLANVLENCDITCCKTNHFNSIWHFCQDIETHKIYKIFDPHLLWNFE